MQPTVHSSLFFSLMSWLIFVVTIEQFNELIIKFSQHELPSSNFYL